MEWKPKHIVSLVGIVAGAYVLAPVGASAAGALQTIVDPVNPSSKVRVTSNGALQTDLRDVTTGTWAKVDGYGSVQTTPLAQTTVLYSKHICGGSAPNATPNIDISRYTTITIVLEQVVGGESDQMFVQVPNADSFTTVDTLSTASGAVLRNYTAPGRTLSIFCGNGTSPGEAAITILGRP